MRRFRTSVVVAIGAIVVQLATAAPALAVDSMLSLDAVPESVTVGDTVSLAGTLSFSDESSSAGQTIVLTRDDAAGTHALGDVLTAADGSYAADDAVDVGGAVTYRATFAGAGAVGPSEATDAVSVDKLPTNVSVSVSDHAITFGASVRIRGHLGKGADSRVLELYAKPDGHQRVLLRKAKVNDDGYLATTYAPSRDTTFTARYDGDTRHRASEDSTVTRVRVILKARLTRFASTSGKYRIYRRGSYAHCEVRVSPDHHGSKVSATLQAYTGGRWKTLDKAGFRLNASSTTQFVIRGTSNVNFRVMVRLPTHTDHLGDASPWLYLRFK